MAVKDFPCDLCGSTDAVEVPYARLYTNNQPVYICRTCGFVYVRSRRSAEEIADSWSKDLFGEAYTARIPAVVARQTYVADTLDKQLDLRGKQVGDIGAGEGQFLEIIRERYGARVYGIEPSSANCKTLSSNGIDHFEGSIEAFSDTGSEGIPNLDIITIMWTLENCMSCRAMLAAAHDALGNGGHIAIATGSRLLVPFKKPLHTYLSENPADTHSFRWSANTLRGIMAVSGFETTYINHYLDSDILMVIATWRPKGTEIEWEGDDFVAVHDFFDRWHHETVRYR
ncbi:MAG TPA: methyltransferase domain-containing protein [Nitrospirae bacterium]|nr:methyltransferase domain-containing protein [Nitrospirota bacterium]